MGFNSAPGSNLGNGPVKITPPAQESDSIVEISERNEELEKLLKEATHSIENEYSAILDKGGLNGYEANRASWMATFPESLEKFTERLTKGGIEASVVDRMKNLKEVQEYYKLRQTIEVART